MADGKQETERPNEAQDLNRRQFFVKLGAGSLAVAGLGGCVFGLQYLAPSVLYEPAPIVSVGKPEHYPVDSVTLDPRFGIFVVRLQEGFYAMSAVCTHLGCLSVWKPEMGKIACPCHGSYFQRDGSVIAGPAPRPLPWLKMWITEDGSLMVDRATTVPAQNDYVRA
ncbi:MAG TPA: ubiquinol-cytochrome c reductase iron-sulfur subunit [Candidatus Angelobacter sp.]|jgi:cytochrome b6-f complex iron-sulfur subunit|nr:ubiquinol-cytochrome c reductase iron-sulfur subunit [Candidatus Angelobacter sp.]